MCKFKYEENLREYPGKEVVEKEVVKKEVTDVKNFLEKLIESEMKKTEAKIIDSFIENMLNKITTIDKKKKNISKEDEIKQLSILFDNFKNEYDIDIIIPLKESTRNIIKNLENKYNENQIKNLEYFIDLLNLIK